jgi:hypothetical protein
MRFESVELLQYIIKQNVLQASRAREQIGLLPAQIEAVVSAMGIVASLPISTFDTEQSEDGRRRRCEV